MLTPRGHDRSAEAEAEDLAIALLLRERAGESSAEGVPLDVVIGELGFTPDDVPHVAAVLAVPCST